MKLISANMPSKKKQKLLEREDNRIDVLDQTSGHGSKWQTKARLDTQIPKSVPLHAQKIKQQLEYVYRASRGQKGIPRKVVKHFCDSFDQLYNKLLPGIDGMDPLTGKSRMDR